MDQVAPEAIRYAWKVGGGLAVGLGLLGALLAWPQGNCSPAATTYDCYNAFGDLAAGGDHSLPVILLAVAGALLGAAIARVLLWMGVFTKSELGIDEDS